MGLLDEFRKNKNIKEKSNNNDFDIDDIPYPESDGITNWHELSPIRKKLWGIEPRTHLFLGMVRNEHDPTMRIYDEDGEIIGLTSDEIVPNGFLVDDAGKALLARKLPLERISLPDMTYLGNVSKMRHYPYSGINVILIAEGMQTVVRAASWACRWQVQEKYNSGIPVIGYINSSSKSLSNIKLPDKCRIIVKNKKTASIIKNKIKGHDVCILEK